MASTLPTPVSLVPKVDGVDRYLAAHINTLQDEVQAIERGQHSSQTVTEAVLVSGIDFALGETVYVTLTANRVMGAILNPIANQRGKVVFINGASWTVTLPASVSAPGFSLNNGANAITELPVEYSASLSKWIFAANPPPHALQGTNVFNVVTDYSADPTGVADSTTAIQNALTAVPAAGGIVYFPPGTYLVTAQLNVSSKTTMLGAGYASAISTTLNTATNLIQFVTASTGITVRDLRFTNTSGASSGITVGIKTNTATDCLIVNCHFDGGSFIQAILVYFGSSCRIQGCHFSSIATNGSGSTPGDAINVFTATEVAVTGNTFLNCAQDACYFNSTTLNCSFSGNTVVGCPEGVQIRTSCSNVTVTGNSFNITPSATINSFAVILQTDTVDCTISDNVCQTTGTAAHPLAAIAIQVRCHRTVVSGNTVNGYYNKGVLILTTGAGGTESLDCAVVGNAINGTASYGIHIGPNENGTTISANSLRATGDNGIQSSAGRTVITGNKIRGALNQGIACGGTLNTVVGNHISDSSSQGIAAASTLSSYVGNVCYNGSAWGINESGSQNIIQGNVLNTNTSGAITSTSTSSHHDNNLGYNPVGVVSPAVPGTGVAVAAVDYDRTFYVTTAALGCTMTIQSGPAVVIPASSFGTVRVPAGQTVTPTFTNAPTWLVEGE